MKLKRSFCKRLRISFILVTVIAAFTADAYIFNCDFSYQGLPSLFPRYSCVATITVTDSATLLDVTGEHLPNHSNANVEFLWISNQNFEIIPKGISEFFPNITALRFVSNNMISISADDLQLFPHLGYLVLFGNNFTSLDGDLFTHTPLLVYIHLGWNQIQHIGHHLVTKLDFLESLYLNQNICIDMVATTRAEVIALEPNLSQLCPPLEGTTTVGSTTTTFGTTTSGTTVNPPTEECLCDDEIEALRHENQQQNEEIAQLSSNIEQLQHSNNQLILENEKLFELNTALEERLLEVEKKLREIFSKP